MDKLLHRGSHAVAGEETKDDPKFRWSSIAGIDANMTRGDRALTWATFGWGAFWKTFSLCVLGYTLLVGRLSPEWWFGYAAFTSLYMPLVLGVLTTVWFTWGGYRDLKRLLHDLRTAKPPAPDDDGQIHQK